MGRPLSPSQIYTKISSACGATPTEQILNAGGGPQMSRKANQSPRNEIGQRINTKWETKDFGMGTCPVKGVVKEEKFPHNRNSSHKQGQCKAWEAQPTKFTTEIMPNSSYQWEAAHMLVSARSVPLAWAASWVLRERTDVECRNILRWLMQCSTDRMGKTIESSEKQWNIPAGRF